MRNILLTNADGSCEKTTIAIPGTVTKPPKYLLYEGKLYRHTGMSGTTFTQFYHQEENFYAHANTVDCMHRFVRQQNNN